jgi:LmbE family N-acetylglucosaminyl deacetylase
VDDLAAILQAARPQMVYTHNLADKHDTHVAVALKVIAAIRMLPGNERPQKLYGCEVWRGLDWLVDSDKVSFDLSRQENLQAALLGVYDSQISGGKRYDLASLARRRANATYFESHGVDVTTGLSFGMDMSALILEDGLAPFDFIQKYLQRFMQDVTDRLQRVS